MGAVAVLAAGLCGITELDVSRLLTILLGLLVVMVPLAIFVNDNERARRREVSRIYGRRSPARIASSVVYLLYGAFLLVTDSSRRRSGPLVDLVFWGLIAAMLVTTIWWFHERRVLDQELDSLSSTRPEST